MESSRLETVRVGTLQKLRMHLCGTLPKREEWLDYFHDERWYYTSRQEIFYLLTY